MTLLFDRTTISGFDILFHGILLSWGQGAFFRIRFTTCR